MTDSIRPTDSEVRANRAETRATLAALGITSEEDIMDRLHAEREVCTDCGRMSSAACPYGATTDSECSMIRERSVAGVSNVIPSCPAHGEYMDGSEVE